MNLASAFMASVVVIDTGFFSLALRGVVARPAALVNLSSLPRAGALYVWLTMSAMIVSRSGDSERSESLMSYRIAVEVVICDVLSVWW